MSKVEMVWLGVGFLGQAVFTARFLVQWIASERKRDSVIPVAFWWLSLAGGLTLLSYALYRQDPVIIVGQSMGAFIYVRNLMLVSKGKRNAATSQAKPPPTLPKGTKPHLARVPNRDGAPTS